MKQFVISDLAKSTVLLTLLDSKIPQSLIIKNFVFPRHTKKVLVDTAVRNKLTEDRFMYLDVKDTKAVWESRKYVQPDTQIMRLANRQLGENRPELVKSFLTEGEIYHIVAD